LRLSRRLAFELAHDERGVDAKHTEGVVEDNLHRVNLEWFVYDQIWHGALGVEVFDVDGRVNDVVLKGREVARQFERSGSAHAVANEALGVVDVGRRAVAEHLSDCLALLDVAHRSRCRVGVDDIDVFGLHARDFERGAHALRLAHRIRQDVVAGVRIDAVADDLGDDLGAARLRVFKALEYVDCAALGHDDAVAGLVKWAAGFVGVALVGAECALALEAGKNAKGLDALAHSAGQRDVDFAEAEHLQGLDQACVARRTGCADTVVWSGDAHVDGDFTGRVVGHGARIVVVGPVARVIVELRDVIHLVLGLDVAMLSGADVHADAALVKIFEIQAAVLDRFVGRVDGNAAGASADAELFSCLVLLRVEVANTGWDLAHVAHVDDFNARDSIQKILSIFLECVAVGGCQADSCDNYTGFVHG
jgi:hypothetical protein